MKDSFLRGHFIQVFHPDRALLHSISKGELYLESIHSCLALVEFVDDLGEEI